MTVKTHKFSSGTYKIVLDEQLDGLCIHPDRLLERENNDHEIWVDPKLTGMKRLETIVHESLHAENPNWEEPVVAMAAHNVARLLWRLGYRARK